MLNEGEGDIIAMGLTITRERTRLVDFTVPLRRNRQVLVQRKPENWRRLKQHELQARLLRDPADLLGREVYVRPGSSYYSRLEHLAEELGGEIRIVEMPGSFSTEDLIRLVAEGTIPYTVADEDIALINQAYYNNVDIATPVSLPQRIAWAVRKTSPVLLDSVNAWIRDVKSGPVYNVLYKKYYRNRHSFRKRMSSDFCSLSGGKISPWDDLLKQEARKLGWDWLLLAAQVYQESRFDSAAVSWNGAAGLLQLLPATAEAYGCEDPFDPRENLRAGTDYLLWLTDYWSGIPDSLERIKFVLGSFNVGHNHVRDAQRLARKYGASPVVWDGAVAHYLELESQQRYFSDPVVKYGYCRGREPVEYVRAILDRYQHYRRLLDRPPREINLDSLRAVAGLGG
jgi:membrane-bound lytic murein transglycosylase F